MKAGRHIITEGDVQAGGPRAGHRGGFFAACAGGFLLHRARGKVPPVNKKESPAVPCDLRVIAESPKGEIVIKAAHGAFFHSGRVGLGEISCCTFWFGEDKDSFDDRMFGGQKIAGSLGARERGGAYFPERADPPRSWASTGVVGASGAWRAPGGVSRRFASVFCAARSESRPRPRGPKRAAAMEPAKRARTEFFPSISKIRYEGPESTNPLAFKYYQPDELVMGKKMRRVAPKPGGAFQDRACTRDI